MAWYKLFILVCWAPATTAQFSLTKTLTGFQMPAEVSSRTEERLNKLEALIKETAKGVAENRETLTKIADHLSLPTSGQKNLGQADEDGSKMSGKKGGEEAATNEPNTAAKELLSIQGNLKSFNDEIKLSKTQISKLQKTLAELKETQHLLTEMVTKEQQRLKQQCLDSERQDSLLLDAIPVHNELTDLAFHHGNGSSIFLPDKVYGYDYNSATDGNRDSDMSHGSCFHTGEDDPSPWWQGTLMFKSEVHTVTLTNRGDCCSERLRNFDIQCYEDDPLRVKGSRPRLCKRVERIYNMVETIKCDEPVIAKYIRIAKRDTEHLTLCEVEAQGYVLPVHQTLAIQSSLASGDSLALLATDSDLGTCSETLSEDDSDHWWQLDLREKRKVTSVTLTNRKDKKHTWLSKVEVQLFDSRPSTCTVVPFEICATLNGVAGPEEVVTLTCDPPVTGRYLRIVKKNQKGSGLSLCDVNINSESLP